MSIVGRAERRKQQRVFRRKLTDEQFNTLMLNTNSKAVQCEVENQIKYYQELWSRHIIQAFKEHGISDMKAKMVLDTIEVNMTREMEIKRQEQEKELNK